MTTLAHITLSEFESLVQDVKLPADCCIAGLAKQKQAILLHKDPEFEQVEAEIFQHKLLYKTPTP